MHHSANNNYRQRFEFQGPKTSEVQNVATLAVAMLNVGVINLSVCVVILFVASANQNEGLNDFIAYTKYYYVIPVGSLLGGAVAHVVGNRLTLLASALFSIAAWLMMFYAKNVITRQIALVIAGLTLGIIKASSFTYVAEVSGPRDRSVLMTIITLCNVFGNHLSVVMQFILSDQTAALYSLSFPVIAFVALAILPESPSSPAYKKSVVLADVEKSATKSTINRNQLDTKYFEKSNLIPLATMLWMFVVRTACDPALLINSAFIYTSGIFKIEQYFEIIYLLAYVGIPTCVILICLLGKKKIMYVSYFGEFFFLLVASVCVFLSKPADDSNSGVKSIIVIATSISFLLSQYGLKTILNVYNGELSPVPFRRFNAGLAYAISDALELFFSLFLYPRIFKNVSGVVFLVFAIISFVGGFSVKWLLPETEGKDLKEIKYYYKTKF